jgi:hypothetical protein
MDGVNFSLHADWVSLKNWVTRGDLKGEDHVGAVLEIVLKF